MVYGNILSVVRIVPTSCETFKQAIWMINQQTDQDFGIKFILSLTYLSDKKINNLKPFWICVDKNALKNQYNLAHFIPKSYTVPSNMS